MNRSVILLPFLVVTVLCACGSPSLPTTPSASPVEPTLPAPSPSFAATPFTLNDALGRSVTLAKPPTRIAVAGKGTIMVVDALYLFPEAPNRITAIGTTTQGADFLPIIDPHASQKTPLGSNAGPEQIAAAQPDLVVLKSSLADQLGAAIASLGIPVAYVDFETPDQYFRDLQILGEIFQDETRAQQVTQFYRDHTARVAQGLEGLTENQEPSVLVLQRTATGGETAYNVPPASWMQTLMVEMAGGRPVWKDSQLGKGWTVVTLEQIAAWNPDQVYIIDYFNDPALAVQKFLSDPNTQNLNAARSKNVFAFPKDAYSWDQPDTRWILGLTWLAKHLHPDRFANVDMNQEILTFYETLYGLDRSTVTERLLPLLRGTLP